MAFAAGAILCRMHGLVTDLLCVRARVEVAYFEEILPKPLRCSEVANRRANSEHASTSSTISKARTHDLNP